MPRVQQYTQQVQSSALPGAQLTARVTPDAAGGAFAQAANQLGGMAAQVAAEEKRKADEMRVLEADNQVAAWERDFLYDPRNGALHRMGRDAFGVPDEVERELARLTSEIESTLSNDSQRMAFRRATSTRTASIQTAVQRHVNRQMTAFDDTTTKEALELSRQRAISLYDDPEAIELEIARQKALIVGHAERNGLPTEYVQNRFMAAEGETHLSVINQLAESSPLAAREYYEANKDRIEGQWGERAKSLIDTKVKQYEAQSLAMQIVNTSEQRQSDWLARANEIQDPETRNAVKQELAIRWREVQIARDEATMDAFNAIENGAHWVDIDESTWGDMTPDQRRGAQRRYREVQQGLEPAQDHREFLAFANMPDSELKGMSEAEFYHTYRGIFDDAHWAQARNRWLSVNQPQQADQNFTSIHSISDVTDNAAATAGIIPVNKPKSKWSDEEISRYASFLDSVQREVEEAERAKGVKLTRSELVDLINDRVADRVYTRERGNIATGMGRRRYHGEVPELALLPGEDGLAVPFEDIPIQVVAGWTAQYERATGRIAPTKGREAKRFQDRISQAYLIYRNLQGVPVPNQQQDPEGYQDYMRQLQLIADLVIGE